MYNNFINLKAMRLTCSLLSIIYQIFYSCANERKVDLETETFQFQCNTQTKMICSLSFKSIIRIKKVFIIFFIFIKVFCIQQEVSNFRFLLLSFKSFHHFL